MSGDNRQHENEENERQQQQQHLYRLSAHAQIRVGI